MKHRIFSVNFDVQALKVFNRSVLSGGPSVLFKISILSASNTIESVYLKKIVYLFDLKNKQTTHLNRVVFVPTMVNNYTLTLVLIGCYFHFFPVPLFFIKKLRIYILPKYSMKNFTNSN